RTAPTMIAPKKKKTGSEMGAKKLLILLRKLIFIPVLRYKGCIFRRSLRGDYKEYLPYLQ
ncbi:MAG: hypothetical protein D3922_16725, partial [Candidatus Electrothrix sp. AR1]|nr:hypothetical protein [Candidatus Electrothrix sp. AR1]